MFEFFWHGSCSVALRWPGAEFLLDPNFSSKEDYGDWYWPNDFRPDYDTYFREHRPTHVFITHGHYDHFDLETCKRLEAKCRPIFMGSPEVVAAVRRYIDVPDERLQALRNGDTVSLPGGVTLTAMQGVHWITGEEGDIASRKLDRPDRYGVMPAGGPMLSVMLNVAGHSIYISGDNELKGIPNQPVDVAVLSVGSVMPHPATKVYDRPIVTVDEASLALRYRLKP
ncbi:MAG: MBL fold metallo-hydrolase, partial [Firmicutes bacterium]|nr:MBL fold metallo-hydrolase [Bacillota bacterium]